MNMQVANTISSMIFRHMGLFIVALIGYILSTFVLSYPTYTVAGFMMVILLYFCYLHQKGYAYFVVIAIPLMGVIQENIPLEVGKGYTSVNIGGVFTIIGLSFGLLYLAVKRARLLQCSLTKPILLFILSIAISITYLPYYKLYAVRDLARLYSQVIIYFLIVEKFKDFNSTKKFLTVIYYCFIPLLIFLALTVFFPSLRGGLLRNVEMDLGQGIVAYRLTGFLHATSLAAMLIIYFVLTLFFYKESPIQKRWIFIPILILVSITLFATLARNAWISFVIVLFMIGVLRYRGLILILLVVMLFSFAVFPRARDTVILRMKPDDAALGRLFLAEKGWSLFLQRPILGWGQGYFQLWSAVNLSGNSTNMSRRRGTAGYGVGGVDLHNDYLRMLIETGIVGFLIYWVLMYRAFKLSFKLFKLPFSTAKNFSLVTLTVLVAIQLSALTGQGFKDLALQFWVYMGITEVFLRHFQNKVQQISSESLTKTGD